MTHVPRTEKFSEKEVKIINLLYMMNKPVTTYRTAQECRFSWGTAKRYLLMLQGKNTVESGKFGKSIYWWLVTIK